MAMIQCSVQKASASILAPWPHPGGCRDIRFVLCHDCGVHVLLKAALLLHLLVARLIIIPTVAGDRHMSTHITKGVISMLYH